MSTSKIIRYNDSADRRKARTKGKIRAVSTLPRLKVFRSNKYVYAQIIDDMKGVTLAGVKGVKPEEVGTKIAEKAVKAGVKKVAFDRSSYNYHGKVKILAEAARKAGMDF